MNSFTWLSGSARKAVDRLAVVEGIDRRDRLDAQSSGDLGFSSILIDQLHRALGSGDRLLQHRGHACRTAPGRPEVDDQSCFRFNSDDAVSGKGPVGRRQSSGAAAGRACRISSVDVWKRRRLNAGPSYETRCAHPSRRETLYGGGLARRKSTSGVAAQASESTSGRPATPGPASLFGSKWTDRRRRRGRERRSSRSARRSSPRTG